MLDVKARLPCRLIRIRKGFVGVVFVFFRLADNDIVLKFDYKPCAVAVVYEMWVHLVHAENTPEGVSGENVLIPVYP